MEQFNVLLEPVRAFLLQLGEFLPRILVAILILVAGWLVAKAVKCNRRQMIFNVQGFVGTSMVFHADIIGVPMTRKEEG